MPTGRAPAEIAHHWHAAHDHPRALVTAKRAAERRRPRYAYAEQTRLLERVLELWEQVPDAAERLGIEPPRPAGAYGASAIDSGDHMRALNLTRAALADIDAAAEPLRAAACWSAVPSCCATRARATGSRSAREAYRLLQPAPNSSPSGRRCWPTSPTHWAGSMVPRRRGLAEEAKAAAVELGDVAADGYRRPSRSAEVCAGPCARRRRACRRCRPPPSGRGAISDLPSLARAQVNISDTLFELGRYEESAATAAEGVPDADRVGVSRTTGVYLLANNAEALMALGHWDEADARLADAARLRPARDAGGAVAAAARQDPAGPGSRGRRADW